MKIQVRGNGAKVMKIYGLDDIRICTQSHRLPNMRILLRVTEDDNVDFARRFIASQRLQDFKAVQLRQVQVQQNNLGWRLALSVRKTLPCLKIIQSGLTIPDNVHPNRQSGMSERFKRQFDVFDVVLHK